MRQRAAGIVRTRLPSGFAPPRNFRTNGSLTIATGAASGTKSPGPKRRPAPARAPKVSKNPPTTATTGAGRASGVDSPAIGSTVVISAVGLKPGSEVLIPAATTPGSAAAASTIADSAAVSEETRAVSTSAGGTRNDGFM